MDHLVFYWLVFIFSADIIVKLGMLATREIRQRTPKELALDIGLNMLTLLAIVIWLRS